MSKPQNRGIVKMLKIFRFSGNGRDSLEKKWDKLANAILSEALKKAQGGDELLPGLIMDISIRKFRVGAVRLKEGNFVVDVTAFRVPDPDREMTITGWLCFDSEMDFVLYLDRVWFRYIEGFKHKRCEYGTKQLVKILREALNLEIEERGFKTGGLKEMILAGVSSLAGIGLWQSACLCGDFSPDEIGCFDVNGKHKKLELLADEMRFNSKVPEHLKYLESWMVDSPY